MSHPDIDLFQIGDLAERLDQDLDAREVCGVMVDPSSGRQFIALNIFGTATPMIPAELYRRIAQDGGK